MTISFIDCTSTRSRIPKLANNLEIENLRNKSYDIMRALMVLMLKQQKVLSVTTQQVSIVEIH